MKEKEPCRQVSGEGGERGVPGARARIPPQPMEIHGGAEIQPAAHGGLQTRAGGCPKEAVKRGFLHGKPFLEQAPSSNCDPVERGVHAAAGLLSGLVTLQGNHSGASC